MRSWSARGAAELPWIRSTTIVCPTVLQGNCSLVFAVFGTMICAAQDTFSAISHNDASACEMFRGIRNSARLSGGRVGVAWELR